MGMRLKALKAKRVTRFLKARLRRGSNKLILAALSFTFISTQKASVWSDRTIACMYELFRSRYCGPGSYGSAARHDMATHI